MTATVVELRPNELQTEVAKRDLDPRMPASRPMPVGGADADDEAYRNSSPRLKLAAWMAFAILCIVSWWIIAKLLVMGWHLIAV